MCIRDRLGGVAPCEIFLHLAAQLEVGVQLGWLGPARARIRQRVRTGRSISTAIGVARQLATDRRRVASQPAGDRAHRLTASTRDGDLFALCECQTATLQIAPAPRTDATLGGQPSSALLAIR